MKKQPGLPKAVFEAFSEAKTLAYKDMRAKWFLQSLPWYAEELAATHELMGANFAPYGVEPNRKTLEALFRYSHAQGLASRVLTVEEVFEPSTLALLEAG